jgi:hypothetical protein
VSPSTQPERGWLPGPEASGSAAASADPTPIAVLLFSLAFAPNWLCGDRFRRRAWKSLALVLAIERPD